MIVKLFTKYCQWAHYIDLSPIDNALLLETIMVAGKKYFGYNGGICWYDGRHMVPVLSNDDVLVIFKLQKKGK